MRPAVADGLLCFWERFMANCSTGQKGKLRTKSSVQPSFQPCNGRAVGFRDDRRF